MKKIFYLASIAALALSSCTKDETAEVTLGTIAGGEIIASVGDSDTRAYLDSNQKFRWQDGDKLAVYGKGTYPMFNSTYAWKSGFTQGVFEGEKAFNADGKYLAVYPRHATSLIKETQWADAWATGLIPGAPINTKGTYLKLNDKAKAVGVTLEIPTVQKYMPGSFYQDIVPAMSTTFDVQENGNAEVDMQPVADYLFVNIKSTDPIKKLSLKLNDGSGNFLKITGQGNPTAYLQNGKVRYYLSNDDMTGDVIDLVTNDYAADVTCHEPQTYVFVIPGSILGSTIIGKNNNGIEAWIWVNESDGSSYDSENVDFIATSRDLSTTSVKDAKFVSNKQMNYYYSNNGTPYVTADDIWTVRTADDDETKNYPYYNPLDVSNHMFAASMPMENMYFWMNPLNNKGERTSFIYDENNDDYIIEHEGQLLEYLSDYNKVSNKDVYHKNAYICDNHSFDFSEANIKKLSSELKANGTYTDFQPYFDDYLNGAFPTINGTYNHVFKGNNAVISGIIEPLNSMCGIFGDIDNGAAITDVTFDGIVAAESDAGTKKENMYYGYILGSIVKTGTIDNVTVKNATGMAIFDQANSTVISELTVEGVEDLNFIAMRMSLATQSGVNNYTKTWATMSGVDKAVFGTLNATDHEVVVLPEGADYADLAWYVGASYSENMAEAINNIVAGVRTFMPLEANQNDNNAVSVLVGDTSVWTGDKIAPAYTLYTAGIVAGNNAKADYKYIEYAEELAGWPAQSNARLFVDMDMSYAVNSWAAPASTGVLEGNGATIKGISMKNKGVVAAQFSSSNVAPFAAKTINDLVLDGVTIDIYTASGYVVPKHIGGLANNADRVENVTVKNLVITGDGDSNNNEQYTDKPSYIGWLVAGAYNPTIKNSKVEGVDNKIAGIAALVGYVFINDLESAKFENVTASSVSTPQTQLTNFWDISSTRYTNTKKVNLAGTAVGYVHNNSSSAKSIEFTGTTGKPVFIYGNNTATSDINVLYDDSKVILKKGDEQYK